MANLFISWCSVAVVNSEYIRQGNATPLKVCLQNSRYNNRWGSSKLSRRHLPIDCQNQHSAAVKHRMSGAHWVSLGCTASFSIKHKNILELNLD